MKLAITPSNEDLVLVLFDTDSKKALKIKSDKRGYNKNADDTRPVHRPFGITWSKENIFVASRKNLLVFDDKLNFVDMYEDILDENTHQITYHKDKIIACMTREDCIGFFDFTHGVKEFFHPLKGWSKSFEEFENTTENFHINSVNVKDGYVYIMLHNRGVKHSQILALDLNTRLIVKTINTPAKRAHGIYLGNKVVGTLNTEYNNIIMESKEINVNVPDSHFLRGAAGNEEFCFAHFERRLRRYRGEGGSYIQTIYNSTIKKTNFINDIGAVNDMRRIDGEDFFHNNKYKFPYKEF